MSEKSIAAYRDQVVAVAARQAKKAPRRRCRICKQSRPSYLIQSHEDQCVAAYLAQFCPNCRKRIPEGRTVVMCAFGLHTYE